MKLSYADFVATIQQENTPPGAQDTIDQWLQEGRFSTENNIILDLACSTGYSSRNICKNLVGDNKCFGIDISAKAVEIAKQKAYKENLSIFHEIMDACNLQFADNFFSHVIAGCNFAFIQDREKALFEVQRVLKAKGILLSANFYYTKNPPREILEEVARVINFQPNAEWNYDFWNNFFSKYFNIVYTKQHSLNVLDEETLKEHVSLTLKDAHIDPSLEREYFDILYDIRKVLNSHRQYQSYVVQIWQKK